MNAVIGALAAAAQFTGSGTQRKAGGEWARVADSYSV